MQKSQCLHGTCRNKGWPAGLLTTVWGSRGWLGGSPSPLLASEVLNPFTVPRLISELPIPCWGLSAPPLPSQRKGLFYTQVDSPGFFFFSFFFSKGAKRGLGMRGCLKVKVATDTLFSFVNSIFILHPQHLRLYTWNPPNGRTGGFLCSSPQLGEGGKKVCI